MVPLRSATSLKVKPSKMTFSTTAFCASGRVINANATPRSPVPPGGHYRPAPMPYYLEFYPGLGMHAGYLPGYPASHGCIRLPFEVAQATFYRVRIGTPVKVIH